MKLGGRALVSDGFCVFEPRRVEIAGRRGIGGDKGGGEGRAYPAIAEKS